MDFDQSQMKVAELSRENQDLKTRLEGNSDAVREQEYVFIQLIRRLFENTLMEKRERVTRELSDEIILLRSQISESSASYQKEGKDFRSKISQLVLSLAYTHL
jgi:homeobox protein cut-like